MTYTKHLIVRNQKRILVQAYGRRGLESVSFREREIDRISHQSDEAFVDAAQSMGDTLISELKAEQRLRELIAAREAEAKLRASSLFES